MCKILWRITQLHTKTPFWILVFLAGWLVDWQFVVPKKDLHPSLQLQKKQQKKRAHSATLATVAGIRQEVQQQKLPQKSEGVTGEPQDMKNYNKSLLP